MSFSVKTIDVFERQAKRLIKKYPSLRGELVTLVQSLREDPLQGTAIANNCQKIRLAIKSKGKGKSGGARIITTAVVSANTVFLLSIYDKSDKETITDKEIVALLQHLPE